MRNVREVDRHRASIAFPQHQHKALIAVFPFQNFRQIVTSRNSIEDRVELCIAQDDEDHVVLVLRFQLRHDRNTADRHAGRKLILDSKAVFWDALAPCSPRQQRDVLSRAEEIPRQIAAEHARAEY